MLMKVAVLSLALMFLALTLATGITHKAFDCSTSHLEECMNALNAVTQRDDMAVATTKEKLDAVCSKLQYGVHCVDNHTHYCFNPAERRVVNSVVSESRIVIEAVCVPGEMQEDYLKYAPCLHNVSTDREKCGNHYHQLTGNYGDTETNMNKKLQRHCCYHTAFLKCQQFFVLRDCGEKAEKFFERQIDRMSGSLINQHCALYTQNPGSCNSADSGTYTNYMIYIFASFFFFISL